MACSDVDRLPLVSLVVTTLGRTGELVKLFDSLASQSFRDFDVTVVDQNDDGRVGQLLSGRNWPFPLNHLHTPGERGASRGRNLGWTQTRGRLVLFPDDDCWLPRDFLETGLATMAESGCDMLSGRPTDEAGRTINGRFETEAQLAGRWNIWNVAIEWLVLYRRDVLEAVEGFDEDIGVGADTPWQSSEIQDIMLRAIEKGFTCWYDPDWIAHHEEVIADVPTVQMRRKGRVYARGMGHVLTLHRFGTFAKVRSVGRPFGGALLSLLRGRIPRAIYFANVAIGRVEGLTGRCLGA